MPYRLFRLRLLCLVVALILAGPRLARALEPEQIALVINAEVPGSRKLAEFYAAQRHIPEGRIIAVSFKPTDAASPAEDINPAAYDDKVVPTIRDFLTKNGLDRKVTCLVTFWGVPLRVSRRVVSNADKKELADLKAQLEPLKDQVEQQVKLAEDLASLLDTGFSPGTKSDFDNLGHRAELALNSILAHLAKVSDAKNRGDAYRRMMGLVRDLAGQPEVSAKMGQQEFWPLAPKPPTPEEIAAARQYTADLQQKMNAINAGPQNAQTRRNLRDLFCADLGSLNLARIIFTQIRTIDNAESESAFDSELALLWWPPYPKARWALNPLNFKVAGRMALPGHTLMVMRLDGPTEQSVHDLIETSLKIEQQGLVGEVVLDARGKPATEPYGVYDQTIRNLAEILRAKSSLKVVLDDKAALIPENSEKQIAIYCGWYSLRHYVSPGQFNPGAVGFHIASAELVSLHNPKETGWCHNLMNAGVVATLGPVAEPYLQSFPPADEFFPLLMTGKLSLADVYWKTTPWTSWMQSCIGDPLYRPYKANPPLKREDLPETLKPLVP